MQCHFSFVSAQHLALFFQICGRLFDYFAPRSKLLLLPMLILSQYLLLSLFLGPFLNLLCLGCGTFWQNVQSWYICTHTCILDLPEVPLSCLRSFHLLSCQPFPVLFSLQTSGVIPLLFGIFKQTVFFEKGSSFFRSLVLSVQVLLMGKAKCTAVFYSFPNIELHIVISIYLLNFLDLSYLKWCAPKLFWPDKTCFLFSVLFLWRISMQSILIPEWIWVLDIYI